VALGLFIGPIWIKMCLDSRRERFFLFGLVASAIAMYLAGRGMKWIYSTFHFSVALGVETQTKGLIHLFFIKGSVVILLFAAVQASKTLFSRLSLKPVVFLGRTSLFAYCAHLILVFGIGGQYLSRTLEPFQHVLAALVLAFVIWGLAAFRHRWSRGLIIGGIRRSILKWASW
jgi:hypothetical protein